MNGMPSPPVLATGIGATCCLFRAAFDIVMSTYHENHKNFNRLLKYSDANPKKINTNRGKDQSSAGLIQELEAPSASASMSSSAYGTFSAKHPQQLPEVAEGEETDDSLGSRTPTNGLETVALQSIARMQIKGKQIFSRYSLLSRNDDVDSLSMHGKATDVSSDQEEGGVRMEKTQRRSREEVISTRSTIVHIAILVYFLLALRFSSSPDLAVAFGAGPMVSAALSSFICVTLNFRDRQRQRFGYGQRFFYVASALALFYGGFSLIYLQQDIDAGSFLLKTSSFDLLTMVALTCYVMVSLWECKMCPMPKPSEDWKEGAPTLSRKAVFAMLRPYFWPDANTSDSAILNRIRASLTWVCVALAKVCTLIAPILLGRASTALTRMEYYDCIRYAILYCGVIFASTFLKEAQNLIYLRVAQTAFIQLSETVFHHLHALSLDWHLKKKLGEVIRSMDRGINACDTIMKFLFLRLVPAMTECIMVVIIFASYFKQFALSVTVFFFVFVYVVMTIVMTLWRKKFRKKVSKNDNDWHGRCTDSLMNFETVKYFTAETYEMEQFTDAVKRYQVGSVAVEASVSLLNVLQSLLLQACLATSLALTAMGIKVKMDCCVENGCEAGNSSCCSALAEGTCPGMDIGDFVAVLAYVMQLFAPLNFLGSIYNAIVMATVDLTNLLDILAVKPDVTDAPDAIHLPSTNKREPDVAVEFDDVHFHYPSQASNQGIKGVSFKMKRGTVTAIVGHTGSGKTTLSRLLFRFYDVLQGAVKVNGVDIRALTQKSLRDVVGVVPQATELFNDSIRNNILYGKRDASDDELRRVIEAAQLDKFIESLPKGWDTMVGDRGLRLSGGEKQRTAIARCLLKDPPFLIFDEATSSLDTLTESSVQEALDQLRNDRTCLVVAHRLGTIRHADNIIVLDSGHMIEQGTHDELLLKNGVYAEMWCMQLHSHREQDSQNGHSISSTQGDGEAMVN